ncbi:hypothetical protein CLU79DRAFT_719580 [Phycomyces nitens]|nr:hypothetical protein CLU79DRAFT_719580 [Phycomyces nitens]
MNDTEDYLLMPSTDLYFEKDPLLANLFHDPLPSPTSECNFPSPESAADSIHSPLNNSDGFFLQNLPVAVLESLSLLYQQQQDAQAQTQTQHQISFDSAIEDFEQFVRFEEDGQHQNLNHIVQETETECPQPKSKTKSTRPPRQLECFNCHVTKTPLWRRTPDRAHSLCNACGLYYKQYSTHRPLHIRQKQPTPASPTKSSLPTPPTPTADLSRPLQPAPLHPSQTHSHCVSCLQTSSPVWRKNEQGEPVCNVCGLYPKSTQRDRPLAIRKDSLKRDRDWEEVEEKPSKVQNTTVQSTAVPPPSPPVLANKEWSEFDDSRFKGLLSRMNPQQMHGFLGMLERRCQILRSLLYSDVKRD